MLFLYCNKLLPISRHVALHLNTPVKSKFQFKCLNRKEKKTGIISLPDLKSLEHKREKHEVSLTQKQYTSSITFSIKTVYTC